jgi:hypothetical protein
MLTYPNNPHTLTPRSLGNSFMETLKINSLAFWDNFAGLVPVRVNGIDGTSGLASTAQNVVFTVTKNHGPYLKGEHFGLFL